MVGRKPNGDASGKTCPGCNRKCPLDAFRKDKNKHLGVDSYCKRCRRIQCQNNRDRENTRRTNYLKETNYATLSDTPEKINARARARKAHKEQKPCTIRGCKRKAERHHAAVDAPYSPENATNIMWVCRLHHAALHRLERARGRTKAVEGPEVPEKGRYKAGVNVKVVKLDALDVLNPNMNEYIGATGQIVKSLPDELGFDRMYRVEFDNSLPALAFTVKELSLLNG